VGEAMLDNRVTIWWLSLSALGIVNVICWYRVYKTRFASKSDSKIIWLSFLYVAVCASRSFTPRADVQRFVLFDNWFSSIFVGRSLATVGELAFVAQWAIVISIVARAQNFAWSKIVGQVIVPLIFVAECFSWYAASTTRSIGNFLEESTWGLTFFLIVTALLEFSFKLEGKAKRLSVLAAAGVGLYVAYMCLVDVPMYYSRLIQEVGSGHTGFDFFSGLYDLNTRWIPTWDFTNWKSEMLWMSLYFSFGVWTSIGLCLLPIFRSQKMDRADERTDQRKFQNR
jgi:hypothetical protein